MLFNNFKLFFICLCQEDSNGIKFDFILLGDKIFKIVFRSHSIDIWILSIFELTQMSAENEISDT